MDLPKCKICGEKHRLGLCPSHESSDGDGLRVHTSHQAKVGPDQLVDAGVAPGPSDALGDAKRRELACGEVVTQHAVNVPIAGSNPAEPAKPRAPRGTFDRKAYQRELMRKRRARAIPKIDKWDRKIED